MSQIETLIARTEDEFRNINYHPLRSEIRAACRAAFAVDPAVTEHHVRDLIIADIEAAREAELSRISATMGVGADSYADNE